ncbi:MAG TPA: M1 family peptidase, partial [Cyclobacteriaceae bacterium]
MKGDKTTQRPLMTNSEQIIKLGAEQYGKAATALFILRETVMGRELFDKSFKEYSQRWAFKHPKPADFFRTMEDASAVDLDWFWRGWFYTTDNVDQSIDGVKWYRMRADEKTVEKKVTAQKGDLTGSNSNNKNSNDFSAGPQPFSVIPTDDRLYGEFRSRLDDKAVMSKLQNKNIYEVKFSNKGGLIMPVILEWTYKDGTKETETIPAEIWRLNETTATKVFVKEKEVTGVVLDPQKLSTDISLEDNVFPRTNEPSKFDKFKKSTSN